MIAVLWPGAAWACAVCQGGNAPNQDAYLDMTIFLSLLPLSVIGAVAWSVFRVYRTDDVTPPVAQHER